MRQHTSVGDWGSAASVCEVSTGAGGFPPVRLVTVNAVAGLLGFLYQSARGLSANDGGPASVPGIRSMRCSWGLQENQLTFRPLDDPPPYTRASAESFKKGETGPDYWSGLLFYVRKRKNPTGATEASRPPPGYGRRFAQRAVG